MPDLADAACLTASVASRLRAGGERIIITGAGGWLGLATLELLANALGDEWEQRITCFGASRRVLTLRDGRSIPQAPLVEISALPRHPSLVLHLAFLTKDKVDGMSEADYRAANGALSQTVLDALDIVGAEAVFVASSGAARSANDPDAAPAMQLYGALKKRDEDDFADWANARGQSAVITRIFNIAGPYINKHGAYAIAAFILDALNHRPIVVRAPHQVIRGNVAIREMMSLVFALLLEQTGKVTRFDTGGEPLELAALAHAVSEAIGPDAVERADITSPRIDHYAGDGALYGQLLTAHGIDRVPLEEAIRETADYLQSLGLGSA